MQWNCFALLASTAAKGAYDMSLKSFSLLTFALHFCSVLRGTGHAHTSVSHSGVMARPLPPPPVG